MFHLISIDIRLHVLNIQNKILFFLSLACLYVAPSLSVQLDDEKIIEDKVLQRYVKDEILFFDTRLGKYTLGEAEAVVMPNGIGFHFEGFVEILDFPINFEQSSRSYKGWYINQDSVFELVLNGPENSYIKLKTKSST